MELQMQRDWPLGVWGSLESRVGRVNEDVLELVGTVA